MSRRGLRALVLALLGLLWAAPLLAQTAQVVEYYHTDALGSVRAVTKAGVVVSRHDFLPFGEELQPTIPPPDKRLFTGKERDSETGFDHFQARQVAAALGRFTSPDPTTPSGGADPQGWNRYAYSRSNPFRFVDPDGRKFRLAANILNYRDEVAFIMALIAMTPDGYQQLKTLADDWRVFLIENAQFPQGTYGSMTGCIGRPLPCSAVIQLDLSQINRLSSNDFRVGGFVTLEHEVFHLYTWFNIGMETNAGWRAAESQDYDDQMNYRSLGQNPAEQAALDMQQNFIAQFVRADMLDMLLLRELMDERYRAIKDWLQPWVPGEVSGYTNPAVFSHIF